MNAWDPSGHISLTNHEWYANDKGKIFKHDTKKLDVCTDGKVTHNMKKYDYYGDLNHGESNTTSCFGRYVAADAIPYIVVKPKMSAYKYSVGVIVNKTNHNYLYCVVGEVGPDQELKEVSIYAAWIMKGLKPPKKDKVTNAHMIGNDAVEGYWKLILFKKSSPNPNKEKCGWYYKKKAKKFRKQIKKEGKKCYKGVGKCLNLK